jgi:hypothetical protein
MLNLNMPIELIVSIINTYLRSKYSSLEVLCEIEDLDFEELTNKLSNNNYEYCQNSNQIKQK